MTCKHISRRTRNCWPRGWPKTAAPGKCDDCMVMSQPGLW